MTRALDDEGQLSIRCNGCGEFIHDTEDLSPVDPCHWATLHFCENCQDAMDLLLAEPEGEA